tara:strand:- start:241 stop:552 length:312 start_codon:yes stop_codon:yes gene_type:complete
MRLANTTILISQIISGSLAIPRLADDIVRPLPVDYLLQGLAYPAPSAPLDLSEGIRVGNQADKFGCCISCGYTYCDTLLECVRPWETDCPELINPFISKPILG